MKHLFLSLLIFGQYSLAQNNIETYYSEFDGLVNSYTSDLNTGERFEDIYLTISDNEFRFFETSKPSVGSLSYNNQEFYKRSLKYDLLEDNLLLFCEYDSNGYYIILDKSLVDSFSIYERDFIKLPIEASTFSFYKNGFFEIISSNESYKLFAKYDKTKSQKIGDRKVYHTYSQNEFIVLEFNSVFYEINSKNDVLKILYDRKDDIKLFYNDFSKLERQNKIEFYKRLFNFLNKS